VPCTEASPDRALDAVNEGKRECAAGAHLQEEKDALVRVLCPPLTYTQRVVKFTRERFQDSVDLR
jgi:hypothetical protein